MTLLQAFILTFIAQWVDPNKKNKHKLAYKTIKTQKPTQQSKFTHTHIFTNTNTFAANEISLR